MRVPAASGDEGTKSLVAPRCSDTSPVMAAEALSDWSDGEHTV
jgi:hypothetical protein